MKVRNRLLPLLGLLLAFACNRSSDSSSAIIVYVHSDLAVPTAIDRVKIKTTSAATSATLHEYTFMLGQGERRVNLPVREGLYPTNDSQAAIRVEAQGLLGDVLVVSRTAVLSFVPGKKIVLDLSLLATCKTQSCPGGFTCGPHGCQSETVDSITLPTYQPNFKPSDLPKADASVADAVVDSSIEAGVEAMAMDSAEDRPVARPDAGFDAVGDGPPDVPLPTTDTATGTGTTQTTASATQIAATQTATATATAMTATAVSTGTGTAQTGTATATLATATWTISTQTSTVTAASATQTSTGTATSATQTGSATVASATQIGTGTLASATQTSTVTALTATQTSTGTATQTFTVTALGSFTSTVVSTASITATVNVTVPSTATGIVTQIITGSATATQTATTTFTMTATYTSASTNTSTSTAEAMLMTYLPLYKDDTLPVATDNSTSTLITGSYKVTPDVSGRYFCGNATSGYNPCNAYLNYVAAGGANIFMTSSTRFQPTSGSNGQIYDTTWKPTPGGKLSISVWVNPFQLLGGKQSIVQWNFGDVQIYIDQNGNAACLPVGTTPTNTISLPGNQWSHLVCTQNSTTWTLYRNGSSNRVANTGPTTFRNPPYSSSTLCAGFWYLSGWELNNVTNPCVGSSQTPTRFLGDLSALRIYHDYTLSLAEVDNLYLCNNPTCTGTVVRAGTATASGTATIMTTVPTTSTTTAIGTVPATTSATATATLSTTVSTVASYTATVVQTATQLL